MASRIEKLTLKANLLLNAFAYLRAKLYRGSEDLALEVVPPILACALNPGYSKGLLLFIKRIPLKALGPYRAEAAPGTSSTLSTSRSEMPTRFPVGKFNSGAEISIPSTRVTNRTLAMVANPLVLMELKVILPVLVVTPLMWVMASKKSGAGACWIAMMSIDSIVTGDSRIFSGILDADTTISCPSKACSLNAILTSLRVLSVTSSSWDP